MSKLFLLSKEEAKKIPENILALENEWWWLRSPGAYPNYTMYVNFHGVVRGSYDVSSARPVVRPALILSSPLSKLNLRRSKKGYIKLGNKENGKPIKWIDISEYIGRPCLLMKKPIEQHRFDEKSNDYDKSEIKATLAELDNILFTDLEKSLFIADWEGSIVSQPTEFHGPLLIGVKKGSWLDGADMCQLIYGRGWRSTTVRFLPQNYYCSCCQHEAHKDGCTREYVWFDWCPYCGADMRD